MPGWTWYPRKFLKAEVVPAPQVIMPGYCVQGTVGHKILSGQRKLEMEGRQVVSPHHCPWLCGWPGPCRW